MYSLHEIKESTSKTLNFLKFILNISTSNNFENIMNNKYRVNTIRDYVSTTNTYMLENSYMGKNFRMSYRIRTGNDSKYQNGITIPGNGEKRSTLLSSACIWIDLQRIEIIEDLDDSDLLALSTVCTFQEVQEIYVLHELNKIPELFGISLERGFIDFVNSMYVKIKITI